MAQKSKFLNDLHTKQVPFQVTRCEKQSRNGVEVGIIEGLASTFEKDRGNDVIMPGAFAMTIAAHKENNRPIRMLRQHRDENLIGGFPIDEVRETDEGLFVKGEVNLETQLGRESFALAKQGVLTDMSIGYSFNSIDDFFREEVDGEMIRFIRSMNLWEVSLVNEPMNPGAVISAVKTVTPFENFPLASRDRPWDAGQAEARLRSFTGSEDGPTERYKEGFFWYDAANAGEFGSYKLGFVDVIDGRLVAIPRGIFAAAAAMNGARGGVDIPEGDRAGVRAHIDRYYEKMDLPSPFNTENSFDNTHLEICESMGDVEECLKLLGLSCKKRKKLISTIKGMDLRDEDLSTDETGLDRDDIELLEQIAKKADSINDSIVGKNIERKLTEM